MDLRCDFEIDVAHLARLAWNVARHGGVVHNAKVVLFDDVAIAVHMCLPAFEEHEEIFERGYLDERRGRDPAGCQCHPR